MASACRCASVGASASAGAPTDPAAASSSAPAGASAASFSGPAGASAASLSPPPSDAGARRAWSQAASSARRSTAPTSGVNRPRTTTIPSSSTHVRSSRLACCRRSSACSTFRSMRRHARANPFHVRRRARERHVEQGLLVLRGGHPRDRAHLRVGDLAAAHGVAQLGQLPEGARHPHVLAGGPQREPGPPAQPLRAREATVPALPLVELVDEDEQLVGGGLDASRQLGDAVAEPRELRSALAGRSRRPARRRLVGGLDIGPVVAASVGSRGTLAGRPSRGWGAATRREVADAWRTSPARSRFQRT